MGQRHRAEAWGRGVEQRCEAEMCARGQDGRGVGHIREAEVFGRVYGTAMRGRICGREMWGRVCGADCVEQNVRGSVWGRAIDSARSQNQLKQKTKSLFFWDPPRDIIPVGSFAASIGKHAAFFVSGVRNRPNFPSCIGLGQNQ